MGPAPPPIFLPEVLLPPPFEISAQIGTYHLSDLLTRVTGPGTPQGNDSSRLAVPAPATSPPINTPEARDLRHHDQDPGPAHRPPPALILAHAHKQVTSSRAHHRHLLHVPTMRLAILRVYVCARARSRKQTERGGRDRSAQPLVFPSQVRRNAYSRLFGPPKVKVYRDSRQRRCIRFLRSTYSMHLAFRYWLPFSS
ncbi:hypothetical protein CH63R_04345 [Colletotrichum higginsianum IMI 349063]|uniref:Uncharacterized protein n=1 Tax=Colletotrichum higginsianum (strain IMI 349063) TaxID=759273 RepID=A0A1B7YIX4_COLHI|nr:hypothetical protein CH63R_04345 [Colletotrichum higginsianum IMI 349063]OBR12049.1 hypothetical protein CH63R_04345 [Colletotrichum higginsianum IMI 349063]